jgi:NAD(P)-dependent dehydrogenase (short-subunit alcohol dehydrogenase family)
MAIDTKRGVSYVPTGSAVFDFHGGDRVGDDLFADSLIALDAETGKRLWHFQGVHHDLWDRDFPAPPALLTVTHDGKRIDAIAQTTKSGYVFVLDRTTGKPLFPLKESAYRASNVGAGCPAHDPGADACCLLARMSDELAHVRYMKVEAPPTAPKITELLQMAKGNVALFGGLNGNFLIEELDRGAVGTMPGALITLTRTMALELAESGVHVNCVCPASVDTPLLQASFARTPDPGGARDRNRKRHPLGRFGTPDDVANLVLFLASEEASWITGGTYVIDGGASIARRWKD